MVSEQQVAREEKKEEQEEEWKLEEDSSNFNFRSPYPLEIVRDFKINERERNKIKKQGKIANINLHFPKPLVFFSWRKNY